MLNNDKIIVFDCKVGGVKTAFILTMHDVLTFSVPISEVERLWSRFQQLGPNDEGTVESEVFQRPSFTTDPFLRQVNNVVPMYNTENILILKKYNYKLLKLHCVISAQEFIS